MSQIRIKIECQDCVSECHYFDEDKVPSWWRCNSCSEDSIRRMASEIFIRLATEPTSMNDLGTDFKLAFSYATIFSKEEQQRANKRVLLRRVEEAPNDNQ